MVLKLRPKLGSTPRGHPGCHAFFSPKFFQNSQPTYLPIVYPPKNLLRSRTLLPKKNFSKKKIITKIKKNYM